MKNFLKNAATSPATTIFLLFGLLPMLGFTLMGGYPPTPNKSEAGQNQEVASNLNKQSAPQSTTGPQSADQGMKRCAGEKAKACQNHD